MSKYPGRAPAYVTTQLKSRNINKEVKPQNFTAKGFYLKMV